MSLTFLDVWQGARQENWKLKRKISTFLNVYLPHIRENLNIELLFKLFSTCGRGTSRKVEVEMTMVTFFRRVVLVHRGISSIIILLISCSVGKMIDENWSSKITWKIIVKGHWRGLLEAVVKDWTMTIDNNSRRWWLVFVFLKKSITLGKSFQKVFKLPRDT